MSPQTQSSINRIQDLIKRTSQIQGDDQLRSDLAKYLVVVCSASLEVSIKQMISNYAKARCNNAVIGKMFIANSKHLIDLDASKIFNYFDKISSKWKNLIEKELLDEELEHLESVHTIRNNIVHDYYSKSSNVSFTNARSYAKSISSIIIKIDKIIETESPS